MAKKKEIIAKVKGWEIICYDGKRRKIYDPELFLGYHDDVARRVDELMHENQLVHKCYATALDDDKDIMIFEWQVP